MLKEMLVYCVLLDSCCACIMRRRHVCVAVLVLVFVVYNRQKERHFPKADPYDDVRENIINYDDEGGGEAGVELPLRNCDDTNHRVTQAGHEVDCLERWHVTENQPDA